MADFEHVGWPIPRDTLSPSALKKFEMCPESFRRQYIKNEWDRSSWSAVLGNAVHGAQEVNLRQKTVTLKDMPLAELEDVFSQAFDDEVESNGGLSEIDWTRKDGSLLLPSKAKDVARPVNRLYHELVAPTIVPLATEQWIRVRVPGVVPTIIGKVDVMKLGGGKIDLKFGASAQKEPRKDWVLQAQIYNLADDTPFEWHTGSWGNARYPAEVWTPANAPGLRLKRTEFEREQTEAIVRSYANAMVAMYRMFGPDDPWPGNGKVHLFACDYCQFHPSKGGNCSYWKSWKAPKPKPKLTEATLL
jgi:hypothetical protein